MTTAKEKTDRRSAVTVALIASAAELGYTARVGFQAAVESARRLVPSNYLALLTAKDERAKAFTATIQAFGDQYKSGHVVGYLEPHYARRWGNLDMAGRVAAASEILDKAEPESDKSNRRTELEHKACRAAISAWSHLKGEAGLKKPTPARERQPLAKAAGDVKEVPTSILTVPKFQTGLDAVAFFDRISSDLLNKAVNGNALAVPIAFKSAVQDFRKAIRAAVAESKASAKRTVAAKAEKGTVSAVVIASRTQNPPAPPVEAPVQ